MLLPRLPASWRVQGSTTVPKNVIGQKAHVEKARNMIGGKSAGIDWAAEAVAGPGRQPALAPPRQLALSVQRMRSSQLFESFNALFGINGQAIGKQHIFLVLLEICF